MKNLLLFLFAVTLFACGPKESETLYDEVMLLHDEVMPKIGDIRKVEKSLKAEMEQLIAEDSTADLSNLEANLAAAQNAGSGMMEWMRGFKADELESMSEEEKVAYLKDEKVKIQKVNQDIKNVLGIEEK